MKSRTKNFLLISLFVIGLLGAFVGGHLSGMNSGYKLYNLFLTGDKYLQTRLAQLVLQKIDTNEIKKGHNLLVLQVNNGILSLDKSIEQEEDEEMRKKIKILLQHISLHREKFPKYYDIDDEFLPITAKKMPEVQKILNKYKTES